MTPGLDEEKFFIVSWGNTESRYNPNFHRGLGYSLAGWKKLGKVAAVKGGKRIPLGDTYANEEAGFYYLRVENLSANGVIAGEMKWLTASTYETLERYRVFSGDVLISIAGTIGRIAVFDETKTSGPTILTENCAKLHIGEDVLPEYLMLLLLSRPLQKQMERDYIQTTIPKLGLDRIRQLRLPSIPKIAEQEQVISTWNLEWKRFQDASLEAAHLLDSIDDYLLAELGINLPPEPENTLANRIFTAQRRELAGWRFDPDMAVYSRHTRSSKYGLSKLRDHMLASPQYGANERGIERMSKEVPRYVRITDINDFGELSEGLGVAAEAVEEKYLLNTDDLLFARSGNTVGKTYLHFSGNDEQHIFAGYMIRFRLNPETLLPAYAFAYTLCGAYKEWCSAVRRAAGQPNINAEEYKSLLIPIPSIDKQSEIAARVFEIRDLAKLLRQQAETELEAAKRRIEALLLGDAA